jgi:hypothetical protein
MRLSCLTIGSSRWQRLPPLPAITGPVPLIYRTGLESPPLYVPGHVDGGSHIVSQDDELRRPAVVMGAETYDVDLSHGGRKIAEKPEESDRGFEEDAEVSGTLLTGRALARQARR